MNIHKLTDYSPVQTPYLQANYSFLPTKPTFQNTFYIKSKKTKENILNFNTEYIEEFNEAEKPLLEPEAKSRIARCRHNKEKTKQGP